MFLNESRKEYEKYTFDQENANQSPFIQFEDWFKFAKENALFEPNAMSISTCVNHKPTCRIVLLKQFDDSGFVFFTNYKSKKAQEMDQNPSVAATFFWPNIERQIRIEGTVGRISSQDSDSYFQTRPRDSQLSAWASNQSEVIENRELLEKKLKQIEKKFPSEIPRPDFWGGYKIIPNYFEFWQGRANRYHDRICYEKEQSDWKLYRLNP